MFSRTQIFIATIHPSYVVEASITFHLQLDGTDDIITVPAAVPLNNLPAGDFTVELVTKVNNLGESVINKVDADWLEGWDIFTGNNAEFGYLNFSITAHGGNSYYDAYIDVPDNEVHHYEIAWDESVPAMLFFVDGVLFETQIFVGDEWTSYDDDSASDLGIGYYTEYVAPDFRSSSRFNWVRISSGIRHTSNFTPPSLTVCPAADGTTLLRLALDEGTGTTAADTSGNGNDATVTGATWVED